MGIKVSVIIPVYNGEKYLAQCLDSIACQTLKDIEIICVNDGSTDTSLEILNEYAKKDVRIKVISQENVNAGAARNNGMQYATGEYFSFLDADDFFETDMLEKAYKKATEEDLDVVVFHSDAYFQDKDEFSFDPHTIIEDNLPEKRPFSALEFEKNIFKSFVGWTWDKLFKVSMVRENAIDFQEQRTTNDLKFVYTSLSVAKRIDVMEEIFVHQRKNSTSLSVTREKSWDCCYYGLLALKEELIRLGLFKYFEKDFINYSVDFLHWNLYTLAWPTQEVFFYKLKYEWFKKLGALGKDETYFNDKKDFEILNKILNGRYSDMYGYTVIDERDRLLEERESLLKEREKIWEEIGRLKWENENLKKELEDVYNSKSFKLGRAATKVPRMIRGEKK